MSEHATRDIAFERTVFFSDAVFAIAITLLIIEVKLPPGELPFDQAFAATVPHLFGFLLSFMVIGIYWLNHNKLFARLGVATPGVMRLNLLLLLTVIFLPFPTAVLSERGLDPGVVTLYAISVAALGLMHFILAAFTLRPRIELPGMARPERIAILWRSAMPPLLFGISAFFASAHPQAAMLSWLLLPVALLVVTPVVKAVHDRKSPEEPAT
ncbi:TMEM175 family protein [Glacieibacterium sp.]|uniref:TMEM175 family protein n=1 Tax=Glacieibacterium sp. TaxID=2860237 RepID=UPI003B00F885